LLQLGAGEVSTSLPPAFGFWRDFGSRFVTALCAQPDAASAEPGRSAHRSISLAIAPPSDTDLDAIAAAAPPMTGAEYLTPDVLRGLWVALDRAFTARLTHAQTSVQDVLRAFNPAWHTVGRVHFHLAENRKDQEAPFAFLATFTHGLCQAVAPGGSEIGRDVALPPR